MDEVEKEADEAFAAGKYDDAARLYGLVFESKTVFQDMVDVAKKQAKAWKHAEEEKNAGTTPSH